MLGAITGDIIGSWYEFRNYKAKNFEPLFHIGAKFTDDTVCTVAIADALVHGLDPAMTLQHWGREYWSNGGWGQRFNLWLAEDDPKPYNSWGNGAAMRVGPAGLLATSLDHAIDLATQVTVITHNHPEGLKAAPATAVAIWLARQRTGAEEIRQELTQRFGYRLDMTVDEIRPGYKFTEASQDSVPQALVCALEATDFEDAMRNAVSIGGDSDTIAAIAGSVAEARFGIPEEIAAKTWSYLPRDMRVVMTELYQQGSGSVAATKTNNTSNTTQSISPSVLQVHIPEEKNESHDHANRRLCSRSGPYPGISACGHISLGVLKLLVDSKGSTVGTAKLWLDPESGPSAGSAGFAECSAGRGSIMSHLILLGDSIFDNGAYMDGAPAVIDQVRARLPRGWQASLLAVDGNTTVDVARQVQCMPVDATHLVLSVGGNDALGCLPQLGESVSNVIGALEKLSKLREAFRSRYAAVLSELQALNKPLMVCTIYDAVPGLSDALKAALGLFNEVIMREAIRSGLPVLDLREICTEMGDFSLKSPIEPSSVGGSKLADRIVAAVVVGDFNKAECRVYS